MISSRLSRFGATLSLIALPSIGLAQGTPTSSRQFYLAVASCMGETLAFGHALSELVAGKSQNDVVRELEESRSVVIGSAARLVTSAALDRARVGVQDRADARLAEARHMDHCLRSAGMAFRAEHAQECYVWSYIARNAFEDTREKRAESTIPTSADVELASRLKELYRRAKQTNLSAIDFEIGEVMSCLRE